MSKKPKLTQPGKQSEMDEKPEIDRTAYLAAGKLKDKVALITGGDSGIGAATAIAFAKEGAKVAIVYLNEEEDAEVVREHIIRANSECLLIAGDVGDEQFCTDAVAQVISRYGGLNILVNNAAEQHVQENVADITRQQLEDTFRTNIFGYFFMVQAAQPYLKAGDVIINTTSVTAYRGSKHLMDYAATKGAIVAFTRSLSQALVEKGIRVNAVAPGPVWTPLIPASFPEGQLEDFGKKVPMGRPAQPVEIAPCYVFLASEDSSYMTGQVLHPNGGEIINT